MRIGSRTYILLLIFAAVGLSLLVLLLGASVTVSPPSPAIVINNNNNNNNPATTKATSSGSGGSSSPSGNLRSSTSTTTSTPPLPRAGSGKPRIAYAITVTKDGPFVDGAVVLGYAARKVHDPARGYPGTYEADLVAFVTPGVTSSRAVLAAHGWRVLEKTLPVPLEEIENKKYVDKVSLLYIILYGAYVYAYIFHDLYYIILLSLNILIMHVVAVRCMPRCPNTPPYIRCGRAVAAGRTSS